MSIGIGFSFAARMRLPSDVAFSVGDIRVYWAGVLLTAAILLAIWLAGVEARRKHLPGDTAVDLCLVMVPCGVIGSRIWYVAEHFDAYAGSPLAMLQFWDGNHSVYGAIVLALLGLMIYARRKRLPFLRLTDTLAPGLALAQSIQLWGDFFSQRGYGAEVTDPRAMWFPLSVLVERTDTVHAAVFFYEFLWCALIFALLWCVLRHRTGRDGEASLWYVLLYCGGHAVFNAMRAQSGVTQPSPLVQGGCIVLAAIAALLLIGRRLLASTAKAVDAQTGAAPQDGTSGGTPEPQSTVSNPLDASSSVQAPAAEQVGLDAREDAHDAIHDESGARAETDSNASIS